jgi:hypothetical protein
VDDEIESAAQLVEHRKKADRFVETESVPRQPREASRQRRRAGRIAHANLFLDQLVKRRREMMIDIEQRGILQHPPVRATVTADIRLIRGD